MSAALLRMVFSSLLFVQLAVVCSHDLLDIPGFTHGRQVRAVLGARKLWLATLVNSVFPGIAVGLALYFWNKPVPALAKFYWLSYCAIAVLSAIAMWYVPYFLGAREETKAAYSKMYAGTRQILPARGDNPRPNLFHITIHGLFLTTLILAVAIWSSAK